MDLPSHAPPSRAAHRDGIDHAWKAARAGQAGVVLVTGEAGIGKSHLIEQLVTHPSDDDRIVARGNCSPARAGRLPFGPWVEIARDLVEHTDVVDDLPVELRRSLLPLLAPWEVADDVPVDGLAQTRLFAGFVELLVRIARVGPLLIVVEDVHWIDEASAELLQFVVRSLRRQAVLLVVTGRTTGSPRTVHAHAAMAELARERRTTHVALAPLSAVEMDEVLRRSAHQVDADSRTTIIDRSGGNPFLALYLASRGADSAQGHGVDEILFAALDELSDDERFFLRLLAVLPHRPDTRELHLAVEMDIARASRVTRSLVERGLLVVDAGRLAFRHALVREAIVQSAVPSEMTVVHARAADALLGNGGGDRDDRAGELALHLLGCGRHEQAAHYALRGAAHAEHIRAFAEMRSLLLAVRRLWPLLPADVSVELGTSLPDVLLAGASAARWCGRFEESLTLADEAIDAAAVPSHRPAIVARAAHTKGRALWAMGRVRDAMAEDLRVIALADDGGPTTEHAEALASVAQAAMSLGQAREAVTLAATAVDYAARHGAVRAGLAARVTAAVAAAQLGEPDRARDELTSCLAASRRLDDLELVVRCYGNLLYVHGTIGRLLEVTETAREALDVCARYGPIMSVVSTMMGNYVDALCMLGRWPDAETVARAGLGEVSGGVTAAQLHLRLTEIAIGRGDWPLAAAELAAAEEIGAVIDDAYVVVSRSLAAAELLLGTGQAGRAVETVRAVWPQVLGQDDGGLVLSVCRVGLKACADVLALPTHARPGSDTAAFAAELSDVATVATTDTPMAVCDALACVAQAARIADRDRPETWAALAAAEERMGRPHHLAYACYRQGLALSHTRQLRAAAGPLARARSLAAELGARPLTEAVDEAVTLLGRGLPLPPAAAAPPKAPAPAPLGLTAREQQVLTLLSDGSTNRLIARALGISERTVSVHVTNILAKLGAGNRTQAAHIARQWALQTAGQDRAGGTRR